MSKPDSLLADRTVLVTGATGFVGRHVVQGLKAAGARVRALVRETSDRRPISAFVDEFIIGDLTEADSLEGVAEGADAIMHAGCAIAGTFDAGRAAEEAFLQVNRDGTVNIAREALRYDGMRFVHVSSTAAMGPPQTRVVDESSPCDPRSPYQRSKRAAELALLELHDREGLNLVMLRPCVVAGEGKSKSELLTLFRMVKRGVFPLVGNRPDVRKPMLMVDDLVQAMILAVDRGEPGGIYLLHSDGDHTMGEILRTAAELLDAPRPYLPVPLPIARAGATVLEAAQRLAPDFNPPITHDRIDLFVTDRHIDIGRARRELGFEPAHQDLKEMLGRTMRDYAERGMI